MIVAFGSEHRPAAGAAGPAARRRPAAWPRSASPCWRRSTPSCVATAGAVLVVALLAAVVSAALLPLVRFDFNPLQPQECQGGVDGDAARPACTIPTGRPTRSTSSPRRWPRRRRWRAGWPPCRRCPGPSRSSSFVPEYQQDEKLALDRRRRGCPRTGPRRSSPLGAAIRRGAAAAPGGDGSGAAAGGGAGTTRTAAASARPAGRRAGAPAGRPPAVRAAAAAAVVTAAQDHARPGPRPAAGRPGDAREPAAGARRRLDRRRTAAPACRSCRTATRRQRIASALLAGGPGRSRRMRPARRSRSRRAGDSIVEAFLQAGAYLCRGHYAASGRWCCAGCATSC